MNFQLVHRLKSTFITQTHTRDSKTMDKVYYRQKKNKLILVEQYAPKDGFIAFYAKMVWICCVLQQNGFSGN